MTLTLDQFRTDRAASDVRQAISDLLRDAEPAELLMLGVLLVRAAGESEPAEIPPSGYDWQSSVRRTLVKLYDLAARLDPEFVAVVNLPELPPTVDQLTGRLILAEDLLKVVQP